MHKEPPKPKGRITEKLYSQLVHPIYDTVLITVVFVGNPIVCLKSVCPILEESFERRDYQSSKEAGRYYHLWGGSCRSWRELGMVECDRYTNMTLWNANSPDHLTDVIFLRTWRFLNCSVKVAREITETIENRHITKELLLVIG